MKIVAKTEKGYLVETDEREIAMALGYGWESDGGFIEATKVARENNSHNPKLKIGGEIQIRPVHQYLTQLQDKELSIKSAARTLRELSELMLAGIPTAVVPPREQGNSGGD